MENCKHESIIALIKIDPTHRILWCDDCGAVWFDGMKPDDWMLPKATGELKEIARLGLKGWAREQIDSGYSVRHPSGFRALRKRASAAGIRVSRSMTRLPYAGMQR